MVDYEMNVEVHMLPPMVRVTFPRCDRGRTWNLYSARFDWESRGAPEDLESRTSWASGCDNQDMVS